MRERLIELIFNYQVEISAYEAATGRSTRAVSERLADYLLANGVIVLTGQPKEITF